jgi:type I restriction enzyme S subunit
MPEVATPKKSAGWATVAFGDVVQLSKERSSDPETDGYERFIGLEHIDPGELCVRRWGDISDGVTFTSVFKPGQVLFGKRRAYQRKVAVADFSGVCSGDIYVLEPKGSALLPELLPFICQTDAFFEHAVGTSAGSLSPRTNWRSLAAFEFALPPIEEQRRFTLLLMGIQNAKSALEKLMHTLHLVRDSLRAKTFSSKTTKALEQMTLAQVAKAHYGIVDGPFGSNLKTEHYRAKGIPVIQSGFVTTEQFVPTKYVYVDEDKFQEQKRSAVHGGDIVMAKIGENCGACAIMPENHETGILAGNALKIAVNEDVCLADWVCNALQILRKTGGLRRVIKTTAQPAINLAELRGLVIPVPSLSKQSSICSQISFVGEHIVHSQNRMSELSTLQGTVLSRMSEGK